MHYLIITKLVCLCCFFVANALFFLQGPLKETSGHFWLMVWEQNSRAVIMLNRIVEKEQVCQ